jgi:hypothetical protein
MTMDSWLSGMMIPVKASMDTLKDRNQIRNIKLHVTTGNITKHFATVKVTQKVYHNTQYS